MDDVHIGSAAEERIFTTHLGGKLSDLGREVGVHCAIFFGEVTQEGGIGLYAFERDEGRGKLLGDDTMPFLAHGDLDVRHAVEVVRWIDEEHRIGCTPFGTHPF